MEVEPNKTHDMRDAALNEALDAHAADELDGLSIRNRRLARIDEYEEAAISRPDPYAAVSGMGSASLQRVFEHLAGALSDELDSAHHTVGQLREYAPEIRLLAKLRGAIDTDVEFQSPDAGPQTAAFPRRVKAKGLEGKVATSSRELLPKRWKGNS